VRLYRQGDIVIREVRRLPAGVQRQVSPVLAYGERTGHAHRLEGQGQIWRQDTELYLKLEQPSRVVHDEHEPITLPRGVYQVVAQREYVSPGEDRRVFD